ncbi:hypothetical protein [Mycoplasma sp. 3398]
MKIQITHKLKLSLLFILISIIFVVFIIILFLKISNPYKISIYNYESYLNKNTINKIKKNYSYHTFKNLDEFTRAIKNKKAVAGVNSDYQIAQLIVENKLKKINFKKVFDVNYDAKNKKEIILNLYTNDVKKQFDFFDSWIIKEIKRINPNNKIDKLNFKPFLYYKDKEVIGFEADNKEGMDHFYEFLIPYFTLDKGIAYNPENSEISKSTRNNIKENADFSDIKDGKNWFDLINSLSKKYKNPKFYWTDWFLDNAMIGQFYKNLIDNGSQKNSFGKWKDLNKENYKNIIDHFAKFVNVSTGNNIKDTKRNKLITDGQEIVSGIIEPSRGKADVAIMYNGDALDAYYGKDNFANLNQSNNISFVRPKNTYKNIDAWIISQDTDDKESDALLETLKNLVFGDVSLSYQQIYNKYINNVYKEIKNSGISEEEIEKNLFNKKDKNKIAKSLKDIDLSFYKKYYRFFRNAFSNENLQNVANFDVINYTPSFKTTKFFLLETYFIDSNKNQDQKAISIFDIKENKDINFRPYQPLNPELRTKMIDYYYQITKS